MSFGEWLNAGMPATYPQLPPHPHSPATSSAKRVSPAGECPSPLSETCYQSTTEMAEKAAPTWLRPQEVGEEVGWGPGGGGDPTEHNGLEFSKVQATSPNGGRGVAQGSGRLELSLQGHWARPRAGRECGGNLGTPLPGSLVRVGEGQSPTHAGP